ncbi:hypothetical protein, partial [Rhizobium bangladeshense]|uniref:hypothetical protein n=1 Tax=Rhizobium bangladeshense TaxID=1138189 RepID=UPI001ABFDD83
RQAHNLKAAGSNPAPATKQNARLERAFCVSGETSKHPFSERRDASHSIGPGKQSMDEPEFLSQVARIRRRPRR